MPMMRPAMLELGFKLGSDPEFDPEAAAALLEGVTTLPEAAVALDVLGGLDPIGEAELAWVATHIPVSLERGILASARAALLSGQPVSLSWQPAYDFGVSMWDTAHRAESADGHLNIVLSAPYPPSEDLG